MKDFDEFMEMVLRRDHQDELAAALDRYSIPLELDATFDADELYAIRNFAANVATASSLMLLGKYHVWINS